MADAHHTRPEHSLVTGDTHQPEKLVALRSALCGARYCGKLRGSRGSDKCNKQALLVRWPIGAGRIAPLIEKYNFLPHPHLG